MNIILFAHPSFLCSQSMPRFANMIACGMRERGHHVEIWSPRPFFFKFPFPKQLKKWLGYLDQFVIFPLQVQSRLRNSPQNTIFVFTDQALGPWVPLIFNRPHVIHVHDFMALRSSLGEFPQNAVSWTGRIYQRYIKNGFSQGRAFISVSKNTQNDLHRFLKSPPAISRVVYNGLNYPYKPMEPDEAIHTLQQFRQDLPHTFLLHVGGNQWYKNRIGVIKLYQAYCDITPNPLPLLMIGEPPPAELLSLSKRNLSNSQIFFVYGAQTIVLQAAYSLAKALIFPSIAEGFGWPISEAMTCGCPVLTTEALPMTEVGGTAAKYIPPMPHENEADTWANHAARQLSDLLSLNNNDVRALKKIGFQQAQLFNAEQALDAYETIYRQTLSENT